MISNPGTLVMPCKLPVLTTVSFTILTRIMLFCLCSLKDILYRKRMERELLRAKGLLQGAEKPPDEV